MWGKGIDLHCGAEGGLGSSLVPALAQEVAPVVVALRFCEIIRRRLLLLVEQGEPPAAASLNFLTLFVLRRLFVPRLLRLFTYLRCVECRLWCKSLFDFLLLINLLDLTII